MDRITIAPVLLGTPTTVSAAPSEAELSEENRGGVLVRDTATQGAEIKVTVPADHAGTEVIAYLFSSPVALGAHTVGEDGSFSVTLPADALGAHRVAVYADDGTLIGWDDLTIKAKKK